MKRLVGCLVATAALVGPLVSVAGAAFPGANGLLAVAPYSGPGLMLVDSHGGAQRLLCAAGTACRESGGAPRWSPDGRVLAVRSGSVDSLIYADGSCLNCSQGGGRHPAFTADPTLLTYVAGGRLEQEGIDGLFKATILPAGVSDAVWSGQGRLAIVRRGFVWAGQPGHLRRIGRGSAPTWSPLGVRIAFARRGWVMVARLGHPARRLVRGGAPAWSPDGDSVAFIGAHHKLRIVGTRGGHVRGVGHVRARAVDWQPVPATAPAGCVTPPGSSILAGDSGAVISQDTESGTAPPGGGLSTAYMGCLTADGRERWLQSFTFSSIDYQDTVSGAAVAGNFGALINTNTDPHYGGSRSTVVVYDLRTGAAVPGRGGEQIACPDYNSYSCSAQMDQLVLGSDAVSAVRTTSRGSGSGAPCPPCLLEQIIAADSAGVRILDSASSGSLTGLQLSGDTLTWERSGTPESAQLH